MSILDLYNTQKLTLSFEIFPPKTERGHEILWHEMEVLSHLNPGYISVTYGAGGSTRDKTLEIALKIKNTYKITPLVHFTCVGSGRDEIKKYIQIVKKAGIHNILALRGDPPQGETTFTPPKDGFAYASELVQYIRSIDDFIIAVAGYPEGHMEALDLETDIDNLKRKVDAGANFIITQLFYNNNDFYSFIDKIVQKGITIPVIPGIMPVTNLAPIKKITSMCGATIPRKLVDRLQHCPSDDILCDAGIDYSIEQCRELKKWGVKGFHFYTLNRSQVVKKIIESI